MTLADPITLLKGMGPKTAAAFARHGVTTIEDLIFFFPRAWIDATRITPMSQLKGGDRALIDGQVVMAVPGVTRTRGKPFLRATLADTSGSIEVIWFYATYLRSQVKPGAHLLLYGRCEYWRGIGPVLVAPRFIPQPKIIPIYSAVGGIASARIATLMSQLAPLIASLPDYLPPGVAKTDQLMALSEAVATIHFPSRVADLIGAKKRLALDELLALVVPSLMARVKRRGERAPALGTGRDEIRAWCKSLPFPLTADQQKAIEAILDDLAQERPMNRLVQGDVGSGKTVVGLAAGYAAILNGQQVAWLAPTELLACQHYETAKKLYHNLTIPIALWTRTNRLRTAEGQDTKADLGEAMATPLIIGTHALLAERVAIGDLGLLIIDEQHRFGVAQRAQLRTLGGSRGRKAVHLLSLTATPIPRTMALLLYGDLQSSTIKEKPAGRKPTVTRVVGERQRARAYSFIDGLIARGHQVYVVCPTIEPREDEEANLFDHLFVPVEEKKAVTVWSKTLGEQFPHRRLAMLHGRLKTGERAAVMAAFRAGEVDILVTTTVIEVGVDVPNATVMVIEGAECFGLAQLHQLRGRVGRSDRQAYCLLFPTGEDKTANRRLRYLERTNDGFVLAEKDLELRGPGEITGLVQSGIPPLHYASLTDQRAVARARAVAAQLIDDAAFLRHFERLGRLPHPE